MRNLQPTHRHQSPERSPRLLRSHEEAVRTSLNLVLIELGPIFCERDYRDALAAKASILTIEAMHHRGKQCILESIRVNHKEHAITKLRFRNSILTGANEGKHR
jgi:hypothetical protein